MSTAITLPLTVRGVPVAVQLTREGGWLTAAASGSIPTRMGTVRVAVSVSIEEAPIRALLERAAASEISAVARDFFGTPATSDPEFLAEVGRIFQSLPQDAADLAQAEVLRNFAQRAGGVLAQAEDFMGDGRMPGYGDASRYAREIENAIGDARGYRYGLRSF